MKLFRNLLFILALAALPAAGITPVQLPELTTPATGDLLWIIDVSDHTDSAGGTGKKITLGNLSMAIVPRDFAFWGASGGPGADAGAGSSERSPVRFSVQAAAGGIGGVFRGSEDGTGSFPLATDAPNGPGPKFTQDGAHTDFPAEMVRRTAGAAYASPHVLWMSNEATPTAPWLRIKGNMEGGYRDLIGPLGQIDTPSLTVTNSATIGQGLTTGGDIATSGVVYSNGLQVGGGNTPITKLGNVPYTWDPPSLVNGASATSGAITVAGAEVGDPVIAAHTAIITPDWNVRACVNTAGTVYVKITNNTGATVDLPSGNLNVILLK
jgi:hypothetical protein